MNSQNKKIGSNLDKEFNKISSENLYLKQEIDHLKEENIGIKEMKEKLHKLEKTSAELQNNYAIKKVELTHSNSEVEKLIEDKKEVLNSINEYKTNIELLEKELVQTKQKLGEVLNELSEAENKALDSERNGSDNGVVNKKKGFSFFKKKNKTKDKENEISNNKSIRSDK